MRTNRVPGWTSWAAAVLICAAFVSLTSAATVITPSCGETIGPGGSYVLGGNVGPCATERALTVIGAKLDMGFFTVSCDETSSTGIVVEGEKAGLKGGTVHGCGVGVLVAGSGKHKITGVVTGINGSDGFYVESGKNKLLHCTAGHNNGAGFWITAGQGNKIVESDAYSNNGAGIFLNPASSGSKVIKTLVEDNGQDGILVGGNGNKLVGNTVRVNVLDGIRVADGAGENTVTKTFAEANLVNDLHDENIDCGTNTWKKNEATTAEPDCVQ